MIYKEMNRAISLGFLFLFTVSFVSDGGAIQANEEENAKNKLNEYLKSLPDNFNLLRDILEDYHYLGAVGATVTFVIPAKPGYDWLKDDTTSGVTMLRSSGHNNVEDLYSFDVTITKLGRQSIRLKQRRFEAQSNKYSTVANRILKVEGVPESRATAAAARRQTLKTLPETHHYLPAYGSLIFDLSVGRSEFFLVDNLETWSNGEKTGLDWTWTVTGSTGLQIKKTQYWNTEEHGIPKLYAFEVTPNKTGTFMIEAKQMRESQTMVDKTVVIRVNTR